MPIIVPRLEFGIDIFPGEDTGLNLLETLDPDIKSISDIQSYCSICQFYTPHVLLPARMLSHASG
jgi:hypothetical protein